MLLSAPLLVNTVLTRKLHLITGSTVPSISSLTVVMRAHIATRQSHPGKNRYHSPVTIRPLVRPGMSSDKARCLTFGMVRSSSLHAGGHHCLALSAMRVSWTVHGTLLTRCWVLGVCHLWTTAAQNSSIVTSMTMSLVFDLRRPMSHHHCSCGLISTLHSASSIL